MKSGTVALLFTNCARFFYCNTFSSNPVSTVGKGILCQNQSNPLHQVAAGGFGNRWQAFHAARIARGDCHHWHSRRMLLAGAGPGPKDMAQAGGSWRA